MGGLSSSGGGGTDLIRLPGIFGFRPGVDSDFEREFTEKGINFSRGAELTTEALDQIRRPADRPEFKSRVSRATTPQTLSPLQRISGVEQPSRVAGVSSAFQDPLQQAILSPQFGPTSSSEQALLDAIQSQTQGAAAVRGLGPAGQTAIAGAIAPTLVNLRQQQIGNLQQGFGQDITSQLQGRGQDIAQREADLQSLLSGRGQDIAQREADIGAGITQRGQDIGALLTGREQDIEQRRQDIRQEQVRIAGQNASRQQLINNLLGVASAAAPKTNLGQFGTSTKGGEVSGQGLGALLSELGKL